MSRFINNGLIEMDRHDAQTIGEAVEEYVCDYWGYEHDGNEYYDAILTTPHMGREIPIQIKGARWRIRNGSDDGRQTYSHGRFRLYESDHRKLLENDGNYAFLVYEKHPDGIIPLFTATRPAEVMDDYIGDWYDNEGGIARKSEGSDYRLNWTTIFPNTGAEL